MKKAYLSIVVPAYNEAENLEELYKKLTDVLQTLKKDYEVLFIDDGSTDCTPSLLTKIKNKDKHVKIISFRKNFGQTAAIMAGFDHSVGEIIITMDADLQNDPTDIPNLVSEINKGYDLVSGWRKKRKDSWSKKLPSHFANRLISLFSGVKLNDYGCTLKAYKKDLAEQFNLYGEMHRFMPAIASGVGAKITEIEVKHHHRLHGQSKYGIGRTFKVLLDLFTVKFITSFHTRPIHLFGGFGLFLFAIGGSIFSILAYQRIRLLTTLSTRPLFLVSIFIMLVGIQFITIGLLVEVLIRIYYESQGKRPYIIKSISK